jgi:hypothetical protein
MRGRTIAVLVATCVSLIAAAPAAADSLVYLKDGNVFLSQPDGSEEHQVTADGTESVPYTSVSQADDGTIVVGHGTEVVRLAQNGTELSRFDPPATIDSSGAVLDGLPQDVAVSPDGSLVTFVYYSYSCPIGAGCGGRQTLLYSQSDRATPPETFGVHWNFTNPSWVTNERILMHGGYAREANFDSPGGADDDSVHWFDDDDEDLDDGELSRAGDRLAALRGYGQGLHLGIYAVGGNAQAGAPPPAPELACGTGEDESIRSPSWSPDGQSIAFSDSSGIAVLPVPNVVPGDCPGAGDGILAVPGGSEPDWGPADVDPAPLPDPDPDPPGATKRCRVPQVAGLKAGKAVSKVRKAHCTPKVKRKRSSTVKPGRVIRTKPAAGSVRRAGAKVKILVARR